jgi:hypothetical protein
MDFFKRKQNHNSKTLLSFCKQKNIKNKTENVIQQKHM